MLNITRAFHVLILGASILVASAVSAEPSREDVDQALRAGDIVKAEHLVKEVVAAHPDSAKAHFKYAEILAAQGKLADAKTELSKAEQIQPELAFAKPAAVQSLKHKLDGGAAKSSSASTGFWIVAALAVFAIFMVVRALTNRPKPQPAYSTVNPAMPNSYGPQGAYQPAPQQGGMGSSIMGGLATGAAVGAGIVAGEMLMHKVLDGDQTDHSEATRNTTTPADYSDISGSDFVDSDNGSWSNDSLGDSSSFDSDNSSDWS